MLSINGSFSNDQIYTLRDLSNLVNYAMKSGIEVIPEVDVPAHSK
jgi:N-acetyl-beta-hexosaminidase